MSKKFKFNPKIAGIIAGAVLLVAGLGAGWYFLLEQRSGETQNEHGSQVEIDPIDERERQVQALYSEGKTEEARALAQKNLEESNNNESRLLLTRALVGVELNEGRFQEAATIVDNYPRDQINHALASDGGIAYLRLGNNDRAAEYFELAIEKWPRDDPLYQAEVDYLRKYIDTNLRGER